LTGVAAESPAAVTVSLKAYAIEATTPTVRYTSQTTRAAEGFPLRGDQRMDIAP
jgi:hypothetical protein